MVNAGEQQERIAKDVKGEATIRATLQPVRWVYTGGGVPQSHKDMRQKYVPSTSFIF